MSHVATATKLEPTIRAYGITVDGKHILIEASGPGVSSIERRRARRNHRRWVAARAHLMEG